MYTDRRKASGQMLPMFPDKGMFSIMKTRYLMWKEKYPDKVPFDPAAAIMRVPSERTYTKTGVLAKEPPNFVRSRTESAGMGD